MLTQSVYCIPFISELEKDIIDAAGEDIFKKDNRQEECTDLLPTICQVLKKRCGKGRGIADRVCKKSCETCEM